MQENEKIENYFQYINWLEKELDLSKYKFISVKMKKHWKDFFINKNLLEKFEKITWLARLHQVWNIDCKSKNFYLQDMEFNYYVNWEKVTYLEHKKTNGLSYGFDWDWIFSGWSFERILGTLFENRGYIKFIDWENYAMIDLSPLLESLFDIRQQIHNVNKRLMQNKKEEIRSQQENLIKQYGWILRWNWKIKKTYIFKNILHYWGAISNPYLNVRTRFNNKLITVY